MATNIWLVGKFWICASLSWGVASTLPIHTDWSL